MPVQFSLRDGREYGHSSEIAAYALENFGAIAADRIVVDFLQPVTCEVDLALLDKGLSPLAAGAVFSIKVIGGQEPQVYSARPLTDRPILKQSSYRRRRFTSPSLPCFDISFVVMYRKSKSHSK